jgi:hypothetical protein
MDFFQETQQFLDPLNTDINKPGLAFIKTGLYVIVGNIMTIFHNVNIYDMHLPPIIIEIARVLAYGGAAVTLFKFILGWFSTSKKEENKEESNKQ